MKKTLITILLIIIFLIIYFLQVNFFSWFTLAGVMPNLFVLLVLAIGLFAGQTKGITFGIVFGIGLDFFVGKSIGISAVMLGIIGFFGGYLDKNFSKDSRFTVILMLVLATSLFEVGNYMFNYLVNSARISVRQFIKILILEDIYQIILAIIFYPMLLKLGYKLEKVFKESKILTRYF